MAENLNQCVWEAYEWYEAKTEWYEKFQEGMINELGWAMINVFRNNETIVPLSEKQIQDEVRISFTDPLKKWANIETQTVIDYYIGLWFEPESNFIVEAGKAVQTYIDAMAGYKDEWLETHETAVKSVQECSDEYNDNLTTNPWRVVMQYAREHWWSNLQETRVTDSLTRMARDLESENSLHSTHFAELERNWELNIHSFRPDFVQRDGFTEEDITFITWLYYWIYQNSKKRK